MYLILAIWCLPLISFSSFRTWGVTLRVSMNGLASRKKCQAPCRSLVGICGVISVFHCWICVPWVLYLVFKGVSLFLVCVLNESITLRGHCPGISADPSCSRFSILGWKSSHLLTAAGIQNSSPCFSLRRGWLCRLHSNVTFYACPVLF